MDSLPKNIRWSNIYTQENEKNRLENILSVRSVRQYDNINKIALDRGHLAPCADFYFRPMQGATFYYVNVVPEWHVINNGNWKKIEDAVRNMAKKSNSEFTIITGGHGVLQLKNEAHVDSNIYLENQNRVPVPMYLWKIVCSIRHECIALIVNNNPYADRLN